MKNFLKVAAIILSIGSLISLLSGCTVIFQAGRTSDIKQIEALKEAYAALEKSLNKEIAEKKVSLGMDERGLVITFVDSVLFDSGKAKLREAANATLDKVIKVCKSTVADREIGIDGHTDNQPIKYSGWKSNWELSTARATSVLHYLAEKGLSPERISATGYGEYRPVASNATDEGRQKNRRVEIIILPEKISRAEQETPGRYTK